MSFCLFARKMPVPPFSLIKHNGSRYQWAFCFGASRLLMCPNPEGASTPPSVCSLARVSPRSYGSSCARGSSPAIGPGVAPGWPARAAEATEDLETARVRSRNRTQLATPSYDSEASQPDALWKRCNDQVPWNGRSLYKAYRWSAGRPVPAGG
ncbi:MAG: hypothetical protein ACE5I5_19265 [Candidatus Heimdallarchaeota archaeon]